MFVPVDDHPEGAVTVRLVPRKDGSYPPFFFRPVDAEPKTSYLIAFDEDGPEYVGEVAADEPIVEDA